MRTLCEALAGDTGGLAKVRHWTPPTLEYLSGTFRTCQRGAKFALFFRVFSIFCPMHQNFVL